MRESVRSREDIRFQGPGDIVTEVDTKTEAMVFGLIREEFPDHTLVGEESTYDVRADEGYAWIVDPIDGTRNYAGGLPFYSTVVGLALDGEVLVGVNYGPEREDLFEAECGKGAYLNGKRIHVSERTELEGCIIGFDLPYSDVGARYELDIGQSIWPNMGTVGHSAVGAGISYAAAGRTDAVLQHASPPGIWWAGILLVERRRRHHRPQRQQGHALQRWDHRVECKHARGVPSPIRGHRLAAASTLVLRPAEVRAFLCRRG